MCAPSRTALLLAADMADFHKEWGAFIFTNPLQNTLRL